MLWIRLKPENYYVTKGANCLQVSAAMAIKLPPICVHNLFLRAKRVGIYLANEGEVNPAIIYDICQKSGKQCFLPVIHPLKINRLHFARYSQHSQLITNRLAYWNPALRVQLLLGLGVWILF